MCRGDKKTEGEKKFSLLKCIQKSNVIKKKRIWVLVFSFMYLVSVDPMDRSLMSRITLENNVLFSDCRIKLHRNISV